AGDAALGLGLLSLVEILDDAIELQRGDVFIKVVIHLDGRGTGASADAFHFFQGEDAVLSDFLVADFEALFGVLQQLCTAAQHTGDIGADLHVVLADGFAVQHRVVSQGLLDLHVVEVEAPRDFGDQLIGDMAEFVLAIHQHGNKRAALDRVGVLQLVEFRSELGAEFHGYLSTSPSTISIVPMEATVSAINWPFTIRGRACKFTKEGLRKWTRRGFGEPSLAMKQPNSPRGDSTAT